MSWRDRQDDPVRQQFAAEQRDFYLAKMRAALGMKTPRPVQPTALQPAPLLVNSAAAQAAPAPNQASTAAVCTCNDLGECGVCRAWAARMLELARGKR